MVRSSSVYVDVWRVEERKANSHLDEWMCDVRCSGLLCAPTMGSSDDCLLRPASPVKVRARSDGAEARVPRLGTWHVTSRP